LLQNGNLFNNTQNLFKKGWILPKSNKKIFKIPKEFCREKKQIYINSLAIINQQQKKKDNNFHIPAITKIITFEWFWKAKLNTKLYFHFCVTFSREPCMFLVKIKKTKLFQTTYTRPTLKIWGLRGKITRFIFPFLVWKTRKRFYVTLLLFLFPFFFYCKKYQIGLFLKCDFSCVPAENAYQSIILRIGRQ
jgi:hypothetical protein